MSIAKILVPVAVLGGGLLAFRSAKAAAKKSAARKAQIDTVLDSDDDSPSGPLPPAKSRAIPNSPINQSLFTAWWNSTSFGEAGVPGIWTHVENPQTGYEWVAGSFFNQNPNIAIATSDGALWYWDNGWNPAPALASDYDKWYKESGF